jgi:hypothetical protein
MMEEGLTLMEALQGMRLLFCVCLYRAYVCLRAVGSICVNLLLRVLM